MRKVFARVRLMLSIFLSLVNPKSVGLPGTFLTWE